MEGSTVGPGPSPLTQTRPEAKLIDQLTTLTSLVPALRWWVGMLMFGKGGPKLGNKNHL